jgi:hypothetical protein
MSLPTYPFTEKLLSGFISRLRTGIKQNGLAIPNNQRGEPKIMGYTPVDEYGER